MRRTLLTLMLMVLPLVGFAQSIPTTAAPTPEARDANDVISLFSDAYTDVNVTTFATDWSEGSTATDTTIDGNAAKIMNIVNFHGIQLETEIDLTGFTHFHIDYWTPETISGGEVYNAKLSNHGNLPGTPGETDAVELTNPVTTSGQWVSVDVPLTDFNTVLGSGAIDKVFQIVMSTSGTINKVYIDNLYFYNDGTGDGGDGGVTGSEAFAENFDAATSVDGWTQAGDAASRPQDVTFEHAATAGVEGTGAMRWGGTNSDASAGRAYIVEKVFGGLDLGGAIDAIVQVSVKSEGLTSANVSALTELGPGNTVNKGSLNADLSESDYFTFTFEHTGVANDANFVKLQINVGAGAVVDAGGTILIDDLKVIIPDGDGGSGNGGGGAPMVAAPTPPMRDAGDVISIYSDAYTDISLDALSASFDDSDVAEVMIEGNSTLEIDFTNFVGIDFQSDKQDASAMTHFHMDFWTSSDDLVGKVFNSKFSQWGGTSGEVSAFELPINTGTTPSIESGKWISIDVPISAFTNAPQTRDDIAQFLITSNLDTVYVDNIYLYNDGTGTGGPEPGEELLTNGDFEGETTDPWFVNFGDGSVPVQENGGNTFFFADVETASENAFTVNLSQQVAITQGETYTLTFDAASSGNGRTMLAGIGLNEEPFTNVTETVNITSSLETFSFDFTAGFGNANSRVLFDMGADTGIVVIDNVSLAVSEDDGGDDPMPMVAPPVPQQDQANVISLFSEAYNDVPVDTWRTEWSTAVFTDSVDIDGTPVKKYAAMDVVGIETVTNQVDASDMTNFHIDVWSSNSTAFSVKLVDFGGDGAFGGGDDTEHQVDFTSTTQGEWEGFDIKLSDFTGLASTTNLAQYILVAQPSGAATIFVGNMYFYDATATSIDDEGSLPSKFTLNQNYPNPFNPTTNISYNLPKSGEVTLEVFNIQGQRVATLINGFQSAGSNTVTFDASHLASGVYTYRLISENSIKVRKMLLIK